MKWIQEANLYPSPYEGSNTWCFYGKRDSCRETLAEWEEYMTDAGFLWGYAPKLDGLIEHHDGGKPYRWRMDARDPWEYGIVWKEGY